MKIITLNIWGGQIKEELLRFFKKYESIDVFLLQEVYHNATEKTAWGPKSKEIFREIGEVLQDHKGYFAPAEAGEWGLAAFVKKTIQIKEYGDVFVYRYKDAMVNKDGALLGKNLQYLIVRENDKEHAILNFHGLWNGKGKLDSEDRLNQSKKIVDFVRTLSHDLVLCGDFNLRPDTQSLKMIENELNLKNLISMHGITSTRTSHYQKSEKFADYIFVSKGVQVNDFKILPDEASDHAALYLDFDIPR